jgi:hypothetical protein
MLLSLMFWFSLIGGINDIFVKVQIEILIKVQRMLTIFALQIQMHMKIKKKDAETVVNDKIVLNNLV